MSTDKNSKKGKPHLTCLWLCIKFCSAPSGTYTFANAFSISRWTTFLPIGVA